MARAYYNEIDPFAAQWLRNLIDAGHIARGDVDERSIADVQPGDLAGYTQCHFFAGIGGWSLALRLAGWPDDRSVWTGSCPCQPFSAAGKGEATEDSRHLWPVWFPLIAKCRPAVVFGEQVEAALGWGWLDIVFADLEAEIYTCGASVLPACGVGSPHIRQRVWFVADADGGHSSAEGLPGSRQYRQQPQDGRAGRLDHGVSVGRRAGGNDHEEHVGFIARADGAPFDLANAGSAEREWRQDTRATAGASRTRAGEGDQPTWRIEPTRDGATRGFWADAEWIACTDGKARPVEPGSFPLAHGVSGRVAVRRTVEQAGVEVQEEHWYNRVGALKGFGNAITPEIAAEFIGAYLDATA